VQARILEMILVFSGLMTCVGCFTGIVISFIKRHSRQSLPNVDIVRRLDDIADRLGRLENGVDATAVEVERISEAQRFTARVLAERSVAPSLGEKVRGTTTPH
jgi:hypothetical protein